MQNYINISCVLQKVTDSLLDLFFLNENGLCISENCIVGPYVAIELVVLL